MNNPMTEKALQHPDYTLYPNLFSAVKNVENAVRLLVYDHMKLLQASNYLSIMPSILSISPLKQLLEKSAPKHNIGFYMEVSHHLSRFESSIEPLWNEEALKEPIKEIYFLIHQAYIELDKADIQPFLVKKTTRNKAFEDYLRSQIS
jgi:hypothetical protein